MSTDNPSSHKRANGQFFTEGNPFLHQPFREWMQSIPDASGRVLEPFAGANNLVRLMREAGYSNAWSCYDLDPPAPVSQGFFVTKQDTLTQFPRGFSIVITNPPYLARNSAARRGLTYPDTRYDDLYKHALDKALARVPYVAAIIPESFVVSGLFHDRLLSTVSLTSKMFQDTECPVCLALFVPTHAKLSPDDFMLWDEGVLLGSYKRFAAALAPPRPEKKIAWRFNDSHGELGLRGCDGNKTKSICFVRGQTIPSSTIKHSSRAISRISGVPSGVDLDELINVANEAVSIYRSNTHDTLMTAFKGLRSDGKYRRRLDFATARNLLDHCVSNIRTKNQL